VRIGRLQAQLTQLDAVGERLATMAGVRREDVARAGRGGAVVPDSRTPSIAQLDLAIDSLTAGLDTRADHFTLLESELIERAVRAKLLPGSTPLADGAPGSRFGWRVDPFTGRGTMHEGMDFTAPTGTPILAAGAGVVVFAGYHPAYGNQVDVEHGNGLVTRYAHASRLAVKEGDIVRQGQWIADVGSTGRSTGPHLHFEVRVHDEARDPYRFLQDGLSLRPELAAARPAAAPPRVPRR
jgi:murein DD-endopeptidase MepM/ murein hydrolase activator NlpD